jgi:hypothetical protein
MKGNGTGWQFSGAILSPQSSLIIHADSLQANQTYQFMLYMENRQNSAQQATSFVLVQVVDTQPQLVVIGSVASLV